MLNLNATKLHTIKDEMLLQMKEGLSGTQESPMLMLPTHLSKLPSGEETGSYLALDLGGTNFRVLKVTLHGKGKFEVVNSKHKVDQKLMEGPGEDLFRFFAQKVKEMVPEAVGAPNALPLGFTFSFPVLQTSINVGKLVRWTKGFTCSGVEGQDVVALLQRALQVTTPYTPHPTPYTSNPTPYTLHPTPDTQQPTPYTPHPTSHTRRPTPFVP